MTSSGGVLRLRAKADQALGMSMVSSGSGKLEIRSGRKEVQIIAGPASHGKDFDFPFLKNPPGDIDSVRFFSFFF